MKRKYKGWKMKRKYKLPPVVRVTICGPKAVMELIQLKAYRHNKTLSAFIREACINYNPIVEGKNEKV